MNSVLQIPMTKENAEMDSFAGGNSSPRMKAEVSLSHEVEPEPHHRVVHRKLKNSFAPSYLTILSVIQAVALADLATIVAARYEQFTIVHWLLVLLTFFVLIIIWNVYTIQSNVWEWIPDVRDAAIPFVTGALELFLNHTITLSFSSWLLGLVGIGIIGALGTWHMDRRARKEPENARLLSLLRPYHRLFALYYIGNAILVLLLALISYTGSIEATDGVQGGRGALAVGIVLLTGAGLSFSVLISHLYWRKAVVYARTGQTPGSRQDPVN
jgi:hypothetical protein